MIAVTGANGLLGNFILKKFIDEKKTTVGLKRASSDLSFVDDNLKNIEWRNADVNDSNSLMDAFKNVDTVIHAAAVVSFDPRAKERIYATNVGGTRNVVNTCLLLGIPRLILVSSVAALGRKKGQTQINEDNQWIEGDLNSDYAKSKYLSELEVYRGQEEGLNISIVNPSVILAPADINKSSAQVFKYVKKERLFYVDGEINYVDARDVAEIIFKLYLNNIHGEKFIASAGHVSLKNLMNEIAFRFHKKNPSIKISPSLLQAAAWLEEIRCRLTGSEALISRQSVKMPKEKFAYQNQKSIDRLQMAYRPLSETLDWCCDHYNKAFTTNKHQ
ncbi:MAG: NAD-dependent epimerase/dehydratase family protein [Bacteroidetes bacterium]|nr:NAD-dependent epimerase/dehydratase family protein [Bacteroidota bacterium]MBI3481687.1 NAD-dependent epimerase/dehydratase family protein [Bacteroidota bacterium]